MERGHSGESIYKSPISPTPQVAHELLSVLGLTSAKTNSNQFTENPRPFWESRNRHGWWVSDWFDPIRSSTVGEIDK